MNRLILLGLILTTALGCNSSDADEDDDDDGDGFITDDDDDGDTWENVPDCDDPERPCVERVDAYCYYNLTGATAVFWVARVDADDPQGQDSLSQFDNYMTITRGEDDAYVYDAVFPCNDGECQFTVNADAAGMDCNEDTAGDYKFTAVVVDEDGNESDPIYGYGYRGQDQ